MNNQMLSRSTVDGAQESPGAARLGQRGGRWRSTKLQRALFVLIVIASTLMLIGCPGGDDDSDDSEDISEERARDFRNVMPVVNGKTVAFPTGVMGTAGGEGDRATLSVTGFDTCVTNDCNGTFTLTDVDDSISAEGDSGGETSCFFFFNQDANIQAQGTNINCLTCALQVVGDCVVEADTETVCQVQWLLSGIADDPNAATSTPFDVTFTLNDDGDIVADGVVLVDEDDDDDDDDDE